MPGENEQIIIMVVAATALILFFASLIIIYALAYQRRKNNYSKEKHLMQSEFQQTILQTQIEIQEHTLKNVAQEIHDNIGQVLILAKLNLNTFPSITDDATASKVNDTKQLVGKAINDLRDMSRSLHGEKITELGLHESIINELRILQNTGLYQTKLDISGNRYRMAPQKEMVLFRIVQESVNNAIKHAHAKNIVISLMYEPALFQLMVTDDGNGFEQSKLKGTNTGIGLKNMKNRAVLIGGIFSIDSGPGKGASIKVKIENPEI